MDNKILIGATRVNIFEYAMQNYGTEPEFLWESLPDYAVFRRPDNKKWYAIIMNLPKSRLGLNDDSRVDILDIKCDPELRDLLLQQDGFLPAYHLNRKNWITVLLDGSTEIQTVYKLIDESYNLAKGKAKKSVRYTPTSWLIPANPKYYDIGKAFAENDTILWKQSNTVIAGDTIYIYMAAPYSCVKYKCIAVDVDIPYEYSDDNLTMKKVMKLQRIYTYGENEFGLKELKNHGIFSVRGPRRVPYSLRHELEKASEN